MAQFKVLKGIDNPISGGVAISPDQTIGDDVVTQYKDLFGTDFPAQTLLDQGVIEAVGEEGDEDAPPPPTIDDRFSDVINQQETQAGLKPSGGTLGDFGVPSGGEFKVAPLSVDNNQFEPDAPTLPQIDLVTTLADQSNLDVIMPGGFNPSNIDPNVVSDIGKADAAKGTLTSPIDLALAQGTVSGQSIAQAQTEDLDEKATVRYQLGELYKSIEDGKPLPPWASGPIRATANIMASRGLGKSSMASAAMVVALQEAGLPIAASDAQAFQQIQLQNLNNKQQTTLANAATFAAMDRANLSARMTALSENSRAFLAIDLQNLSNEQQVEVIDYQGRLQTLFSNQAATNAAKTFNAQSTNDVNRFFAQLDVAVQENNKQRTAAMEQFNSNESNAMSRYDASLMDSRDKFYINMQKEINQSNAVWRRTINTVDTAAGNEAARINAQNLLGLSVNAQNRLWQQYRDEASFLMESSENDKQRAHNAAQQASQNNFNIKRYNEAAKDNFWTTVGTTVAAGLFSRSGK
jgi:hypothetical protein